MGVSLHVYCGQKRRKRGKCLAGQISINLPGLNNNFESVFRRFCIMKIKRERWPMRKPIIDETSKIIISLMVSAIHGEKEPFTIFVVDVKLSSKLCLLPSFRFRRGRHSTPKVGRAPQTRRQKWSLLGGDWKNTSFLTLERTFSDFFSPKCLQLSRPLTLNLEPFGGLKVETVRPPFSSTF